MTGRSALTTVPRCSVLGVLRLVVLALTLAGFVAMHGVASAAGGAHCGAPPALMATTDAHAVAHGSAADHGTTTAMAHRAGIGAGVGAPVPSPDSDDLMVGCLLALLGALVAIGLRLLGRSSDNAILNVRQAQAWLRAARAPPDPLFLSLCVFRQ